MAMTSAAAPGAGTHAHTYLPLVEGQTLLHGGRLRFLRHIGCGTFATILLALDVQRDCAVAVKCMQRPEYNAIGEQEAAVLRQIGACDPDGHCAVVRLLDMFIEHDVFCLVLERLGDAVLDVSHWGSWRQPTDGCGALLQRSPASARRHKLLSAVNTIQPTALRSKQQQQHTASAACNSRSVSPLRVQQAVAAAQSLTTQSTTTRLSLDAIQQIAVDLCGALAFLHTQHLIHADVKPENIVWRVVSAAAAATSSTRRSGGGVKLIDFGNCIDAQHIPMFLSQHSRTSGSSSDGFDVQTLAYRAPEVAAGLSLSPAIDLWSLGCVLLECASGAPLFTNALVTADSSMVDTKAEFIEEENSGILRQIELIVADGRSLSSVASAYCTASCYRQPRTQQQQQVPRAAIPTLRQRLAAIASSSTSTDKLSSVDLYVQFNDFITQLLDVDPTTRLTARDALLHPFVQSVFPFALVFRSPMHQQPPAAAVASAALQPATQAAATNTVKEEVRPRLKSSKQKRMMKSMKAQSTRPRTQLRAPPVLSQSHAAHVQAALELMAATNRAS